MPSLSMVLLSLAGLVSRALGDSLEDIEHVILFMQENRAFDHYYGTMAGVRGYGDPNVQINPDGLSTLEQPTDPRTSNNATFLKPWHMNYLGRSWNESSQCRAGGGNGWDYMHLAYNHSLVNGWVSPNSGHAWTYFKRQDIPTHFDIVEGWTVLDMNTESIFSMTNPNRIHWMSHSVNAPFSQTNPTGKGPFIYRNDNAPKTWKTIPEYLQEANITWQVFQDVDNFGDNPLAYFAQFQQAGPSSPLRTRGNSYDHDLRTFYRLAQQGALPQVSFVVGPAELSEHPPYLVSDGAWFQKRVVDAVTTGSAYNRSALFITYDETGSWGDHVVPIVPPQGTQGEYVHVTSSKIPYAAPVGPGFRVPAYVISPWTRGGRVYVEHTDHSSHGLFLEKWAKAKGYSGVHIEALSDWRRAHISNLVNIFNFDAPNYTLPTITQAPTPLVDNKKKYPTSPFKFGTRVGPYVGSASCVARFKKMYPAIPFGEENMAQDLSALVEDGFKEVRGGLTEGRFLTLEMQGLALATSSNGNSNSLVSSQAVPAHDEPSQRWIAHSLEDEQLLDAPPTVFMFKSFTNNLYIGKNMTFMTDSMEDAQLFNITFQPGANGGYIFAAAGEADRFLSLSSTGPSRVKSRDGAGSVVWGPHRARFSLFSVSYKNGKGV